VRLRRPRAIAYSEYFHFPRLVCYLQLDAQDRLAPCNPDDYRALAEWLPSVPRWCIEQELPRMEDFASVPECLPEWSQGEVRYWM
jgi:hypothetical protein